MWPFSRKAPRAPVTHEQSAGGTIGGDAPRPFSLPAKIPAKHQTAADVLDYHCKKHNATYERTRHAHGKVRIRVHMPDGDVFSGTGPTTLDAVAAVVAKMEAVK
jgi:hypothetical protein